MAVEYRASTRTNMGVDDSKIAYKQFFGDGKLDFSAYALRNNPFKVTTVCLGLLCAVLLCVAIGQGVHSQTKSREYENNLKAVMKEKEDIQTNLETTQITKKVLESKRDELQKTINYISGIKSQLNTNNYLLTKETATLKVSNGQLQTTNTALTKELEDTKRLKDEIESNSNAISTAKQLLQKQYDSVIKRRNELQVSYDSAVKERDNLQNKFNNVTRRREQLQLSYNDMIDKVERLQDSYNLSSSEKDKLADSHKNLTAYKDNLEATCSLIKAAEDKLRASYGSLVTEKNEIEARLENVTAERDALRAKNDNLTAQRDQLQQKLDKFNATVRATGKICPSNWKSYQGSCYYTSIGKKSWEASRQYCQNKGADLAVINSREEMLYINSLYSNNKEVWIGLTDSGVEGDWQWVDGSPLTLAFWGKDQPNSHNGRNQDCVEIWHQSSGISDWNDESCTIEQSWICEM